VGGLAISCHCFENSPRFLCSIWSDFYTRHNHLSPTHSRPRNHSRSMPTTPKAPPSRIQMATVHNRTQSGADVTSTTSRLLILDQRWEPNVAAVLVTVSRTDEEIYSNVFVVQHRHRPTPLLRHLKCGTFMCTPAQVPRRAFADAIQQ